MAKCEYKGPEEIVSQLGKLGSREFIRKVVMAGADACIDETRSRIDRYRHVVSGSMKEHVRAGNYYEDIDSGYVYVYPQDEDARGIRNATKAFVINYGRGGNPTRRKTRNKTGDKFITGQKKTMDKIVNDAMQAESERLLNEIGAGE